MYAFAHKNGGTKIQLFRHVGKRKLHFDGNRSAIFVPNGSHAVGTP